MLPGRRYRVVAVWFGQFEVRDQGPPEPVHDHWLETVPSPAQGSCPLRTYPARGRELTRYDFGSAASIRMRRQNRHDDIAPSPWSIRTNEAIGYSGQHPPPK